MKNFKMICGFIILISSFLDILALISLMFSNGFIGAAVSRGMGVIGLSSSIFPYLIPLFPILFVIWIYVTSNEDKYPKLGIYLTIFVTILFTLPWFLTYITVKLSNQKYKEDSATHEVFGKDMCYLDSMSYIKA